MEQPSLNELLDSIIASFDSSRLPFIDDEHSSEPDTSDSQTTIGPATRLNPPITPVAYRPLQYREVRLLVIKPGTWKQKIECNFIVASLDDDIQYEAISYRWGGEMREVLVDGHPILVTATLECFLRRLRRTSVERTVWADAICINQTDTQEREGQVSQMQDIYRKTFDVQIYLGESLLGNGTEGGFSQEFWHEYRACRWYFDGRDAPMQHVFATLMHMDLKGIPNCFVKRFYEICGLALLNFLARGVHFDCPFFHQATETWQAATAVVKHLFDQPWFDRIWTVQEAVLPKSGTVHYGESIFPWEMLESAAANIITHERGCCSDLFNKSLSVESRGTFSAAAIRSGELAVSRSELSEGVDFYALLKMANKRQSDDPRDKVYAILGLVGSWENVDPILPNYSLDVRQVFRDATLKALELTRSINILCHNTPHKSVSLPSWVPDWTHIYQPLASELTSLSGHPNDATGLTMGGAGVVPDGESLLVPGSRVTSITAATRLPLVRCPNDESLVSSITTDDLVSIVLECREMMGLQPNGDDVTNAKQEDDFWNTLIGSRRPREASLAHELWQNSAALDNEAGAKPLELPIFRYHYAQSFFRTRDGLCGITNFECAPGDEIYTFKGSKVYFVLRQDTTSSSSSEFGQAWKLRGPCYLADSTTDDSTANSSNDIETVCLV